MFHKRQKKTFAPGTFIAGPARVAAIIHLCIAFSLLLWIISQPFMGDLFAVKSELLLYDTVFNQPELVAELPLDQQQELLTEYKILKSKLRLTSLEKFKSMLSLLCVYTPGLELAWLFFSLILPVMLLMRIEGAAVSCWLLPALTLAYAIDNTMHAPISKGPADQLLFPTEAFIVHHYLDAPLNADIFEQQTELTNGWQRFLVENWGGEEPSAEPGAFKQQVEKGEFAFTVARLQLRAGIPVLAIEIGPVRQSGSILGLYLMWNCFFAFVAYRWIHRKEQKINTLAVG